MSEYYPDNWVVIKILGHDPHYKVLAGWSGGYLNGTSWRMNSGITKVTSRDSKLIFVGSSGSEYHCHKDTYGLRMNNAYVWSSLEKKYGPLVELMPEETDWNSIDWILK